MGETKLLSERINIFKPKNIRIYSFKNLKRVELNEERMKWFFSTFNIIVDLISGNAFGGKFKNKANMIIEMGNNNLKILLLNADFEKPELISEFSIKIKLCE